MNVYQAYCVKVIDGDTVDVLIDLGFDISHKVRLRLKNLDTYEIRSKDVEEKKLAMLERDKLRSLIFKKNILIKTYKKGKYGRYIADIFIDSLNVNTEMYLFHSSLKAKLIK